MNNRPDQYLKPSNITSTKLTKRDETLRRVENIIDKCCPLFAFFYPPLSLAVIVMGFQIIESLFFGGRSVFANLPPIIVFFLWIFPGVVMVPCKHRIFRVFSWGGIGYAIGFFVALPSYVLLYFRSGPEHAAEAQAFFYFSLMFFSALFTFILCYARRRKEEGRPFWSIVLLRQGGNW